MACNASGKRRAHTHRRTTHEINQKWMRRMTRMPTTIISIMRLRLYGTSRLFPLFCCCRCRCFYSFFFFFRIYVYHVNDSIFLLFIAAHFFPVHSFVPFVFLILFFVYFFFIFFFLLLLFHVHLIASNVMFCGFS